MVTGLTPGEEIEVWLYGDTPDGRKKTGVADANGTVHHTWRITSYGSYDVGFFSADGWSLKATVVVE